MCRFTLYLGPDIRLSSLLLEPSHSLIRQSAHSREREEPLNGDGFGVGWYARELSGEPAVFRSITPAWNNRNLHNLARVVSSDCILAHVRQRGQGLLSPCQNAFAFESQPHVPPSALHDHDAEFLLQAADGRRQGRLRHVANLGRLREMLS